MITGDAKRFWCTLSLDRCAWRNCSSNASPSSSGAPCATMYLGSPRSALNQPN